MEKYEAVVKSLQERSQHVLPLRYRRETPPQPVPVEALCEYEGEQVPSPSSSSSPCAMRRCCRELSPPGGTGDGRGTWGRSGSCQRPNGDVSRSGDMAKVVLGPGGKAGLGSSGGAGQEGSGGNSSLCPPCGQRAYHTPFGRLRQPGSVTFPRSLRWGGGDAQARL